MEMASKFVRSLTVSVVEYSVRDEFVVWPEIWSIYW